MIAVKQCITFLVVISMLVLAGCSGSEDREAKYYSKAQTYFDQENYDKARVELKNVLQINPKNIDARYLLAEVEEKSQNWQKMFALLSSVVETQPDHFAAQLKLGKLFLLSKNVEKAQEKAEEVLLKSPENVDALALQAALLLHAEKSVEAKAMLDKALTLEPGNKEASLLLVKLLASEKKISEALQVIDNAISVHPDGLKLAMVKINLLVASGDKEQAEKVLLAIIERFPDNTFLYYILGKFYVAEKRIDDADRLLKKLIKQLPEESAPKLAYIDFLSAQRSPAEGEKELQALIRQNPGNFAFRFALLKFYKEQPERMVEVLEQIVADDKLGVSGLDARNRLAVLAIAAGDSDKASLLLEEVIAQDLRNTVALLLRAGLLIDKKQYDEAVADVRTVLRDEPDSEKALLLLASAHLRNGQTDLAQEALEKLLLVNPKNILAGKDLARMLVKKGDEQRAIELLEKIRILSSEDIDAVVMLIDLYGKQKKWDKAEAMVKVLEDISDKKDLAYYKSGMIFFAQKKYPLATAEFKKVLAIKPQAVDALIGLVNSYLGQGDTKQAEILMDDMLAKNPENIAFLTLRGELAQKQKQFAEAEAHYAKVVELKPEFELGYRNLASVYLNQKLLDKALITYQAGLKVLPESIALYMGQAAIQQADGEFDAAIESYQRIRAIAPDNAVAINNLGALIAMTSSDEQRLKDALAMVTVLKDSGVPAFQDTYGWLNYLNGNYDEALSVMEAVVSKQDSVPDFHYHLAMAYIQKGRNEEAKLELEKAITSGVTFVEIDKAKAELEKLKNDENG